MPIRYAHTNLIARDWRKLAEFYCNVLGCTKVGVERDYCGPDLDAATNVPNARITGQHLRLPGWDDNGPTLEIFQYRDMDELPLSRANRQGFTHIAFAVDDVEETCEEVVRAGGCRVGEVVTFNVPPEGAVKMAYLRDIEGNMIEVQQWTT